MAKPEVIKEKAKDNSSDDDEDDDDGEVLEESPCGRWLKRREQVRQNGLSIERRPKIDPKRIYLLKCETDIFQHIKFLTFSL